jgi:hypothetical protein
LNSSTGAWASFGTAARSASAGRSSRNARAPESRCVAAGGQNPLDQFELDAERAADDAAVAEAHPGARQRRVGLLQDQAGVAPLGGIVGIVLDPDVGEDKLLGARRSRPRGGAKEQQTREPDGLAHRRPHWSSIRMP